MLGSPLIYRQTLPDPIFIEPYNCNKMTDSDALCISFCHFLSEITALYRKECYARQQYFVSYVQTHIVMYDECGRVA